MCFMSCAVLMIEAGGTFSSAASVLMSSEGDNEVDLLCLASF